MTATLLLIRHAMHTDYGERFTGRAAGVPLSAAGQRQARLLGDRLSEEPIAAVYASPRERARATAEASGTRYAFICDSSELLARTSGRCRRSGSGD